MTSSRSLTRAESRRLSNRWSSFSLVRNFDSDNAPPDFGIAQLRGLFADCVYRVAGSGPNWSEQAYAYNGVWRLVMVSPMAFQDNSNYDLATISHSTTPMATQEGEINFCAYNGGGWRRSRGEPPPDRERGRME